MKPELSMQDICWRVWTQASAVDARMVPELNETGAAIFSPNRQYRYMLMREWDPTPHRKTIAYVLLNPSTAGAYETDPTVTRCVERSKKLGYARLVMVNAFARVETDSKQLTRAWRNETLAEYEGEQDWNRWFIQTLLPLCLRVVCGWGSSLPDDCYSKVREQLRSMGLKHCSCLGTTASGQPKHPLYISYEQPLYPFTP